MTDDGTDERERLEAPAVGYGLIVQPQRYRLDAAEARGRELMETATRAAEARYDRATGRVTIDLTNGCTYAFPAQLVQDLNGPVLDRGQLCVARGRAPCEGCKQLRRDLDLLGDMIEHDGGQDLAPAKVATGISECGELERIAEPRLGRARLADRGEVAGVEAVVADHLLLGVG